MSYQRLSVDSSDRVAWLTIDNPPCNVMTLELFIDLLKVSADLEHDDTITVVVLQSADPDFFIAHFDVELLLGMQPEQGSVAQRGTELNSFDQMCERFRTMSKVTIAKIAGRVGGGGSELAMACDMRFGAIDKAVMNQMEVPVGILPGGGGTQRLARLVGWGRAVELIIGAIDLDAVTGEQWGYFNRALPEAELDSHVGELAQRIASFPPEAVRHAKAAMIEGMPDPTEGLIKESWHFDQLMATPDARRLMQRFLELGGQTRDGELDVADLAARVARGD